MNLQKFVYFQSATENNPSQIFINAAESKKEKDVSDRKMRVLFLYLVATALYRSSAMARRHRWTRSGGASSVTPLCSEPPGAASRCRVGSRSSSRP